MEDNIMVLTDENGNEVKYELLDIINLKNKVYCVFYPTTEGDTEVLITRVEKSENPKQSSYIVENNKEIIDKVFAMFKEKYNDEIIFKGC